MKVKRDGMVLTLGQSITPKLKEAKKDGKTMKSGTTILRIL